MRTVDSVKVFLGVIVQFLGLPFQFLESSLGVDVDRILGVFSNIEARFECLRCPRQTLAKAFQTHCALTPQMTGTADSDETGLLSVLVGGTITGCGSVYYYTKKKTDQNIRSAKCGSLV